jgi:hypothetical protein
VSAFARSKCSNVRAEKAQNVVLFLFRNVKISTSTGI